MPCPATRIHGRWTGRHCRIRGSWDYRLTRFRRPKTARSALCFSSTSARWHRISLGETSLFFFKCSYFCRKCGSFGLFYSINSFLRINTYQRLCPCWRARTSAVASLTVSLPIHHLQCIDKAIPTHILIFTNRVFIQFENNYTSKSLHFHQKHNACI